MRKQVWSIKRILQAFQAFRAQHGDWPGWHDLKAANGLPGKTTVARHCCCLEIAYQLADEYTASLTGEPPVPLNTWDQDRIIQAFQAFRAQHGRWPITEDLAVPGEMPTHASVCRHFGSLGAARRAAQGWEAAVPLDPAAEAW